MKTTEKLSVFTGAKEVIGLPNSAAIDKLVSMGLDPMDAIVKICAETPKDEESEAVVKATIANYCAEGCGDYMPFCAGSSDIRKATSTWVKSEIIAALGKWAMCGLKTTDMKIAPNKLMAYMGLLWSASKPFTKVFGKKVDIRRVAVIKDAEVVVEAIADVVEANEGVTHAVARRMVINAFDGFGIIRKDITGGESVTIRGPWLKAFVQSVDWKKLYAWCCARGIEATFTDFWGNKIALKDVDMIICESCFKAVKYYSSWDQYCTAFEQLGHEVRVCVREHAPRLKGLPYQQGQTLMGTKDDALAFAQYAKSTVYKYTEPKNAAKLLRGAHQQAARMYPALLTETHTKRAMQEMYATKRNDMLGGRIPELGYNAFLAPDLVAFAEHVFGLPIKGCLKAGQCYCSTCTEGPVDVTRNPHLDNAHCLLIVVAKPSDLMEGPTMFINILDATTIILRADYDGDHVWFSQVQRLLDIVKRTYEILQSLPIDWDVEPAEKVQITRTVIATFLTNMIHGSEIGLYADALTKMWANGYDRDVCAWLTWAANVLIDSAKHASVKIEKPESVTALNKVSLPYFAMFAKADADRPVYVQPVALAGNRKYVVGNVVIKDGKTYACVKDCKTNENAELDGNWRIYDGFGENNQVLNPHWVAPRLKTTKFGTEVELPPRCAKTDSFLDMYSEAIQKNVPETLEVKGLEDEIFDVTKLMFDGHRKIGRFTGLSKKGTWNDAEHKFVDCGLFQEIAFRHSTEWNERVGDTSFFSNRQEWEDAVAEEARKEILAWAHQVYSDCEVSDERLENCCYDIIVRNIFNTKMSDGMDTVVKQAFWRIYGHLAVKALKQNLNSEIPDFDSEEFAELFDVEDDND